MSDAQPLPERSAPPAITLASTDPREERAREQLLRLLDRHDLRKWQFTDTVRIDRLAIPYSTPVLTLNTHYLDDDHRALAVYLHEQLHWFAPGWRPEVHAATDELRRRYPVVPTFEAGGARGESSTYLHLVVCPLEYASLIEVIGAGAARATIERANVYTWIYATVLREWDYFTDLLDRHGLTLAGAPVPPAGVSESSMLTARIGDDGSRQRTGAPIAFGAQLYVADLHASADFYTRGLGFQVQYTRPGGLLRARPGRGVAPPEQDLDYVSLRSGRVLLGLAPWAALPENHYLRRGPAEFRGLGMEILLEVDDVHEAERRVVEAGFPVESPCQRRPWGATDFRVVDPDGYYLRITARR